MDDNEVKTASEPSKETSDPKSGQGNTLVQGFFDYFVVNIRKILHERNFIAFVFEPSA